MARTARRDPEREEYERLRQKFERPAGRTRRSAAPEPEPDDDDYDDDGHVMVFTGKRGDSFIERMFGSGAEKGTPPAGDDLDDDDDDDGEEEDPDPTPDRKIRFFR